MNGRFVVAGALAGKPGNGGEAWVRASWVRGLLDLGLDAWFVEELGDHGDAALRRRWFDDVSAWFGIAERSVLLPSRDEGADATWRRATDLVDGSDLLINISGALRDADLLSRSRRRAYVDLDPGFTQIWAAQGASLGLDGHDVHFTVGERIGSATCPLPTGGVHWLPCRQPVVVEDWPVEPLPSDPVLTTIATWRCGFGPLTWDGTTYGLKHHEFRRLVDVAGASALPVELALDLDDADVADRTAFVDAGWRVRDATAIVATPDAFRGFVAASAGELSAAQGVYVHGRTGWFSDRSARYLATGRPVIVQDTALADELCVGEGLLTFVGADDALTAIDDVAGDLERHARAARELAEAYFEARAVLRTFLARAC